MKDDTIEKFLQGKLIFVPEDLNAFVQNSALFPGQKSKELAYLTNLAIRSKHPIYPGGRSRHVHSDRFRFRSSSSTEVEVRKCLEAEGFIKSYPSYSKGWNSKVYEPWDDSKPVLIELKEKSVIDGLRAFTAEDEACAYASVCLSALKLDKNGIRVELANIISEYEAFVDAGLHLKDGKGKAVEPLYGFGRPLLQLWHNLPTITRGRRGNRLCSPMTCLKSDMRQFFSFDNSPMVELDMRCAQPCLLGNLAGDNALVKDANSDEFYKRVRELYDGDRELAKDEYCRYAYGPNRIDLPLHDYMRKQYGSAAAFMAGIKKGDYRKFSHLMQQEEADLFIDKAYLRLKEKDIPAITIHDSFLCRASDESMVRDVIESEMHRKDIKGTITMECAESKGRERRAKRKEKWGVSNKEEKNSGDTGFGLPPIYVPVVLRGSGLVDVSWLGSWSGGAC